MKAQFEKRRLIDLRPHPLQPQFYTACSDADNRALIDDLRQRGQTTPIVIMPADNAAGLPENTMLDGHRRTELMPAAGITEALVEVREDLKNADAATVDAEFLKYNLIRRQLHPIDKARAVKRLHELEKRRGRWTTDRDIKEARDRVGAAIGMSGRNLARYWSLLETPLPIQQAVRDRRLSLALGARVSTLHKEKQKQLAEEVGSLSGAREIAAAVERYFAKPVDGAYYHENIGNAVASFARKLKHNLPVLQSRRDQITPRMCSGYQATLMEARDLLTHMLSITKECGDEE